MLQQSQATEWHTLDHPVAFAQRKRRHPTLERLICAAIGDERLAETLIRTPAVALQRYELGRRLSPTERRLVLGITDASDIFEFAGRLHAMAGQTQVVDKVMHDEQTNDRASVEAVLHYETYAALPAAMPQS